MRKKWIRAAMLITAFSLLATGCGGNPSDSGNQNDSYEDYTPDKKPAAVSSTSTETTSRPNLRSTEKGTTNSGKTYPFSPPSATATPLR